MWESDWGEKKNILSSSYAPSRHPFTPRPHSAHPQSRRMALGCWRHTAAVIKPALYWFCPHQGRCAQERGRPRFIAWASKRGVIMIARWREEEKKWRDRGEREGEKDKVERVGMIATEREKGMNGQRARAVEDKSICSTPLRFPQIIFQHQTPFKRWRKKQKEAERHGAVDCASAISIRLISVIPGQQCCCYKSGGSWSRPTPDSAKHGYIWCHPGAVGVMCSLNWSVWRSGRSGQTPGLFFMPLERDWKDDRLRVST